MDAATKQYLEKQAVEVRRAIIEMIGNYGNGHIGGALSAADIVTLLYFNEMNIDPTNPLKNGRDRFVLSKGHAGPVLYAVLALRGYFNMAMLKTLNKPGTLLPSHCDMLLTPGVDMTAGSLGQGVSCAVGMAKAAKLMGGKETIYALIGDGESQEGQVWEASMAAAYYKLNNLILFLDYNRLQLDGPLSEVMDIGDPVSKWRAFGFWTTHVNGHDMAAMSDAILLAEKDSGDRPSMIVLDTIKGKGVPFIEKMGFTNHCIPFPKELMERALAELDKKAGI